MSMAKPMATSGITSEAIEQSIRSIGKRSRPVWVILTKKGKPAENTVFIVSIYQNQRAFNTISLP
jgi:hypothetical protein